MRVHGIINLKKEVLLSCSQDEYFCDDFCGVKEKCLIEEEVCRDCVGSSIYLTHLFNNLGKSIVSSGESAQVEDLLTLFESGSFATITAKSVYNHVDYFNGKKIQAKFSALCETDDSDGAILVLETNPISKIPQGARYLICGEEFFHIDNFGGVVLHE